MNHKIEFFGVPYIAEQNKNVFTIHGVFPITENQRLDFSKISRHGSVSGEFESICFVEFHQNKSVEFTLYEGFTKAYDGNLLDAFIDVLRDFQTHFESVGLDCLNQNYE